MCDEQELLKRAAELETRALAEIYDLYSDGLYRYAMRRKGQVALAEDCVAETFARFLRALRAGGGPREHLQAYLYRIAHNWLVDQCGPQAEILPLGDNLPGEVDVPEEAQRCIRQRQVRNALRSLTPDQQQVVALKYLEEWSNEEVACALHKPVGAVKSLQHRALNSLKKLLSEAS